MSDTASTEPEVDVVWENTVDQGRFSARVTRTSDYIGQLVVTVVESKEKLLDEEVHLDYRAIFGPDVANVADWESNTIKVIDAWIAEHDKS